MWYVATDLHLANWPAALFAAVPMAITFALFLFAQRRLPRDNNTLLFEVFLFCILWWQGFDVMVRLAGSEESAAFWRGLLRFGQMCAVPTGLNFALSYSGADRILSNRLLMGLLYGQTVLMVGLYQNGVVVETLVYHPGWGWLANAVDFPMAYQVMVNILGLTALGTSAVLIRHAWVTREIPGKREASRLMAIGHVIPTMVAIVFEIGLPTLGYHQVPITGSLIVIFAACAAIALTRYNLFSVSTPAAAKAVLETITDPMLIARADGTLLYANTQALAVFDLDKDYIQGVGLGALFASEGERMAFFAGRWKQTLEGDRFTGLDAELRTLRGVAPFLVSLAPIPVTRQGEYGVAVVAHDVRRLKTIETDLMLARDAAEAANRTKSMFLANMSHELRTPLNAIIGYSEMLEEDTEDDAAIQDLDNIATSGRYLLALINDILDLAKVESGKLEVHPVAVDLARLLEDVDPDARQLALRNGNAFRCELPADVQPIWADLTRTRQVVLNLLSNAFKFTEQGVVTLTVTQTSTTRISIQDTGIGMNEAQLAKLFGTFSQVHEKNHGKYGGTGLGLALSQKLCQMMGGDITVVSEPGRGTTFTIELPNAP